MKRILTVFFFIFCSLTKSPAVSFEDLFNQEDLKGYSKSYEYNDGLIVLPKDGRAPFLNALRNAKESIVIGSYKFSDPILIEELAGAMNRGGNLTFTRAKYL